MNQLNRESSQKSGKVSRKQTIATEPRTVTTGNWPSRTLGLLGDNSRLAVSRDEQHTSEIQKFFDFETRLGSVRCKVLFTTRALWVLRDTQRTRTKCPAEIINIIVYCQWRETATDNNRHVMKREENQYLYKLRACEEMIMERALCKSLPNDKII